MLEVRTNLCLLINLRISELITLDLANHLLVGLLLSFISSLLALFQQKQQLEQAHNKKESDHFHGRLNSLE